MQGRRAVLHGGTAGHAPCILLLAAAVHAPFSRPAPPSMVRETPTASAAPTDTQLTPTESNRRHPTTQLPQKRAQLGVPVPFSRPPQPCTQGARATHPPREPLVYDVHNPGEGEASVTRTEFGARFFMAVRSVCATVAGGPVPPTAVSSGQKGLARLCSGFCLWGWCQLVPGPGVCVDGPVEQHPNPVCSVRCTWPGLVHVAQTPGLHPSALPSTGTPTATPALVWRMPAHPSPWGPITPTRPCRYVPHAAIYSPQFPNYAHYLYGQGGD